MTRTHCTLYCLMLLLFVTYHLEIKLIIIIIIIILAHTLLYMWGVRLSGKAVTLFLTRAQLESKINILRETRYRDEHLVITEMFDLL